jgi:hypothetical protein
MTFLWIKLKGDIMNYAYKMIQVPYTTQMKDKDQFSRWLEELSNRWGKDGWEFYRIDDMSVQISNGCVATLAGRPFRYESYNVITFRKPYQ